MSLKIRFISVELTNIALKLILLIDIFFLKKKMELKHFGKKKSVILIFSENVYLLKKQEL